MSRIIVLVVGAIFCFPNVYLVSSQQPPKKEEGEILPDGLKALKHPDQQVRFNAVELLGKLGKTAKFAVPHLAELLKDPSISVRIKTAESLWKIEQYDPKKLVPVLLEGLEFKEEIARVASLSVLSQLGEQGKAALPAVRKALKDKSFSVQLQAIQVVSSFGPPAKDAIPDLLVLIRDDETGFLEAPVTVALSKIGGRGVPLLIQALQDKSNRVRRGAAFALGLIGPKAYEAVPDLAKALKDTDSSVRNFAAEALGKIGPEAESARGELKNALKDPEGEVQVSAALALWRIVQDKGGIGVITGVLAQSKDATNRKNAAAALGVIGPAAKSGAKFLAMALKDAEEEVRRESAAALGQIGPEAQDHVKDLRSLFTDKNVPVQMEAALAVWRISKAADEKTINVFINGLKQESPEDQIFAAESLGEIAAPAKSAVPALIAALKGRDPEVRLAVALALKKIDPKTAAQHGIK